MRQRGRKSAASLLVVNNVDGTPPRLPTPVGLNTRERVVFEMLVNACSPNHFRKSDTPLLVSYVQACLLSHRLGRTNKLKEWEASVRVMVALSTKLRLNPHTRSDPKTVAREPDPWLRKLRKPWESKHPSDPAYDAADDDDDEKKLQ